MSWKFWTWQTYSAMKATVLELRCRSCLSVSYFSFFSKYWAHIINAFTVLLDLQLTTIEIDKACGYLQGIDTSSAQFGGEESQFFRRGMVVIAAVHAADSFYRSFFTVNRRFSHPERYWGCVDNFYSLNKLVTLQIRSYREANHLQQTPSWNHYRQVLYWLRRPRMYSCHEWQILWRTKNQSVLLGWCHQLCSSMRQSGRRRRKGGRDAPRRVWKLVRARASRSSRGVPSANRIGQ